MLLSFQLVQVVLIPLGAADLAEGMVGQREDDGFSGFG